MLDCTMALVSNKISLSFKSSLFLVILLLLDTSKTVQSFSLSMMAATSKRVVVVGGGIQGTSVAYHLAERGCTDVTILEAKAPASAASGKGGGFSTYFPQIESDPRGPFSFCVNSTHNVIYPTLHMFIYTLF